MLVAGSATLTRIEVMFAALIGFATLASSASATTTLDYTTPRWTRELVDDGRARPGDAVQYWQVGARPWVRTANGGVLIVFAAEDGVNLLAYSFGPDGTQTGMKRIGDISLSLANAPPILYASPNGGAWLQLDVQQYGVFEHLLLRLSDQGEVLARLRLEPRYQWAIEPRSDGGLILAGPFELRRVDAAGNTVWTVAAEAQTSFGNVRVRNDGSAWVTVGVNSPTGSRAQLKRYSDQGTLLATIELPCLDCANSDPNGLELHPDGGVIVSGTNPARITRLDAQGTPLWTTPLPVPCVAIKVDATGLVIADGNDGLARALDVTTGQLLWSRQADFIAPQAGGALVLQYRYPSSVGFLAQGLDRNGTLLWEQRLDAPELESIASVQGAAGAGIEFISTYAYSYVDPTGCAVNPGVIRFDPAEGLRIVASVCAAPRRVGVRNLYATGDRFVAHTTFGLEAYGEDGHVQWRYEPEVACRDRRTIMVCYPQITAVAVTSDGGAWLLEDLGEEPLDYNADRLRRLDAQGRSIFVHSLEGLPHFDDDYLVLATTPQEATLYWTNDHDLWGSIGWHRVDTTSRATDGEVRLAEYARLALWSAKPLEDGDALLAYVPDTYPWNCPPVMDCGKIRINLLRIDRAGSVLWRYDSPVLGIQDVAIATDGVTWIAGAYGHHLQRVAATGQAGPVRSLSTPDYSDDIKLHVANGDHVLHATWDGVLRLLDTSGQVAASATLNEFGPVAAGGSNSSARGFLFQGWQETALLLLGPEHLEPRMRARFDIPTPVLNQYSFQAAAIGDDGMYAASRTMLWPDSIVRTHIARFDEPGSVAAERITRDGFEP